VAEHIDQSTAPLSEKLHRFLMALAKPDAVHFYDDGFPKPTIKSEAFAFLSDMVSGRLIVTDGVTEVSAPKRCEECRATGAVHCSDPENCGGPWDKRKAGVGEVQPKQERCEACGDVVPKAVCYCQTGCVHAVGRPPATAAEAGVTPTRGDQPMDPQRLRELADPSHAAFEEAMRQTWQMVDPIRPAGQPGSYYRGEHNGVIAALKTMRDNYERARRADGVGVGGGGQGSRDA
jgi:hypothetical protein